MNSQSEFNSLLEHMCIDAQFNRILRHGEAYIYPHRRADIIGTAKALWDSDLNPNQVIVILNTLWWHGMIFTVNGAYYRDIDNAGKVFYFNYDDITSLDIAADGKSLSMFFSNGDCRANKNSSFYDMYALKDTLEFLRDFALRDIEVIQPRSTGWLRKPWMSQKQFDACSAIIHSAALAGNMNDLIKDLAEVFEVSMDSPAVRALQRNFASVFRNHVGILGLDWWALDFGLRFIDAAGKFLIIELIGWRVASYFLDKNI